MDILLTAAQITQAFRMLAFMFAMVLPNGQQLLPRGERDVLFRWELAQAIAAATDDEEEQFTLARLAAFEAGFRRNVARCDVKGDHGKSLGEFQIQPMSPKDAEDACSERLSRQVGLALRYMRLSADKCPKNKGAAKLHLYVSGRCDAGHVEAARRWGGQDIGTRADEKAKVAGEPE